MNDPMFVMRVLTAFQHELTGHLFWRVDNGTITFFVNCSDTFEWGCADAEEITPGNIDLLEKTIADTRELDDYCEIYADILFASRVRRIKPMAQWLALITREGYEPLLRMFDEVEP